MARAQDTYQFPAVMGYLLLLLLALFLVGCAGSEEKKEETTTTRTEPSEVATVVVTTPQATIEGNRTGTETTLSRDGLLVSSTSLSGETARVASVSTNGGIRGSRSGETAVLRDGVSVGDPIGGAGLGYLGSTPSVAGDAILIRVAPPGDNDLQIESLSTDDTNAELPENPFRSTTHAPFSTFSIDVDGASYTNVRGYLERGDAPPPAAVRIEELINYFTYSYPDPTDGHPFAFATEVAPAPWNSSHQLVRVALQGERMNDVEIPPSNLVFLIDVSGSMSGRLALLKQAFTKLIEGLRPEDRVAIVTYAGAAGLALKSTAGDEKKTIQSGLDRLRSGGSTAGGAGIHLAYKVAAENFIEEGNNRVILATDGDFNVGVRGRDALIKLVEEKRDEGVSLSVLGFGYGNYMDDAMEGLADNGNGNYYYIDRLKEAERIFTHGLAGTLLTIAKDVKLQIRFNPEHVAAYRLIGYENRSLTARQFADDQKDAGDLGAGHAVTAFYEVIPQGVESAFPLDTTNAEDHNLDDAPPNLFTPNDILLARLRYKEPRGTKSKLIEHLVRNEPKALAETGNDFRFAAAVAGWGMLMRGSRYVGASFTPSQIITLAESGLGNDYSGYRSEAVGLMRMWLRSSQ